MNRKTIVKTAFMSILFALLFALLTKGIIYFTGDIVSLFDDTVGEILCAWKNAVVSFSLPITLACGTIFAVTVGFLLRSMKGKSAFVKLLLVVLMIVCAIVIVVSSIALMLYTCRINQVPFSVFFDIVFDLVKML